MRFLTALLPIVLLCSCITLPPKQIEPAGINEALRQELLSWLGPEAQAPEAYVAGLFREHDVEFVQQVLVHCGSYHAFTRPQALQ